MLVEGSSRSCPRQPLQLLPVSGQAGGRNQRCFDKLVLSVVEGLSMSGLEALEYVIELPVWVLSRTED
jgi:hypothetical protein